jgi:hypothetical protein
MLNSRTLVLTTAIVLIASTECSIAHAQLSDIEGWAPTKWGMTNDEVLGALSGTGARSSPAANGDPRVIIDEHPIGGRKYTVTLVQSKGRGLVRVSLTPVEKGKPEEQFEELKRSLTELHGPPASSEIKRDGLLFTRTAKWDWPKTSLDLNATYSPAFSQSVLSALYGMKGEPENLRLQTVLSGNRDRSKWSKVQQTNALTGQSHAEFTLYGRYLERPRRDGDDPFMRVRCFEGKRQVGKAYAGGQLSEAYVNFRMMADTQRDGVLVHYRIDDGKVIDQFWTRSTDYQGGFFGDKELANFLYGRRSVLKEGDTLSPVRKVVVATDEFHGGQVTVQFDMPDPQEVVEACGLILRGK